MNGWDFERSLWILNDAKNVIKIKSEIMKMQFVLCKGIILWNRILTTLKQVSKFLQCQIVIIFMDFRSYFECRTIYISSGGPYIFRVPDNIYFECRTIYISIAGPYIFRLPDHIYFECRTIYISSAGPYIFRVPDHIFPTLSVRFTTGPFKSLSYQGWISLFFKLKINYF